MADRHPKRSPRDGRAARWFREILRAGKAKEAATVAANTGKAPRTYARGAGSMRGCGVLDYRRGFKHGLPIALGYISVSFAFGIQASAAGLYPWQALLISMLNVTSAGQMAGLQLMVAGAGLPEMALTQLTINLRYGLMSLALSQKLDGSMTLPHRLAISFCNTDEVFILAAAQPGKVGRAYLYGLTNGPYLGWALGTFAGAVAGNLLPVSVTAPLGLAIYGMFLAILLPPFRHCREIRFVVLVAVALSCLFTYLPVCKPLTGGFRIILCAVGASALGAWLFPEPAATEAPTPCDGDGLTEQDRINREVRL